MSKQYNLQDYNAHAFVPQKSQAELQKEAAEQAEAEWKSKQTPETLAAFELATVAIPKVERCLQTASSLSIALDGIVVPPASGKPPSAVLFGFDPTGIQVPDFDAARSLLKRTKAFEATLEALLALENQA